MFLTISLTSWLTNRGYTGHEHLDAFGIINMNGRVYDPATAMFFSPDPFVQSPEDWLNYNRYSYCMNNPTNSTDPSGYKYCYIETPSFNALYYKLNEPNGYDVSSHGGGGSGGSMGQNMWNSFLKAKQDGWNGSFSEFLPEYDKQIYSPNFNGTVTLFYKAGYTKSGTTTGNIKNGYTLPEFTTIWNKVTFNVALGGNMSSSSNSFMNNASNVNNTSTIVGVTADISKAAGFKSTFGVWNGLSKVRYYSSGWSGSNQYVWKTFGIAKGVSNFTMVVGFASDFYLSSTINPETDISYQTWEETGLNSVVSLVVLRAGWWGIPIQMNYMLAKPYLKAIKEHPDWVTYPYRPR